MVGVEGGLHKVHGGDCRGSCSEGQMAEQDTGVQGRRRQDRGLGIVPRQGQLVGECSEAASADMHRSCLRKKQSFKVILMKKKQWL